MSTGNRPLSPHIGVYRWRITSTLSILHRASGVAMSLSLLLLVAWLLSAATGPAAYAQTLSLIASPAGIAVLAGGSLAMFYHLCNGIRHLFWDAGMGFEMAQARVSGWAVVVVSLLATAALWGVVLTAGG